MGGVLGLPPGRDSQSASGDIWGVVGPVISSDLLASTERMALGVLIVGIFMVEPLGLACLWHMLKNYLRLRRFPYRREP
jgi:hypothetical protein